MVVTAVASVVTVVAICLSVAGPSAGIGLPSFDVVTGPNVRLGPIRVRQHGRLFLLVELVEGFAPAIVVALVPRYKIHHGQLVLVVPAPAPVLCSVACHITQTLDALTWVRFHPLVAHIAHHLITLIAPVYNMG